jgi:hypothetical protein
MHLPDHCSPAHRLGLFGLHPRGSKRAAPSLLKQRCPEVPLLIILLTA